MNYQCQTWEEKKKKYVGDSLLFRCGHYPILLERAHWDDFNTNAKNYMTTPREAARVVTATTCKLNKIS